MPIPVPTEPPTTDELFHAWFSFDFPDGVVWGDGRWGTYIGVPHSELPPLVVDENDASWSFLMAHPVSEDPLCVLYQDKLPASLEKHDRHLAALNLPPIPPPLRTLLDTEVAEHYPTATACYLDLGTQLFEVPGLPGARALRFFNDQQGCLIWYLIFEQGKDGQPGRVRVAIGDQDWTGDSQGDENEENDENDEVYQLSSVAIVADGIVEFIKRSFMENVLWFHLVGHGDHEDEELTPELAEYAAKAEEAVRQRKARAAAQSANGAAIGDA